MSAAPRAAQARVRLPLRLKIVLITLLLIAGVVGAITFTMANLFHSDKKAYIHDLTAIMALNAAEEANALLQGYQERVQVFGRLMYDPALPKREKAALLNGLFEDFGEFVAITLYENGVEQATVYDQRALADGAVAPAALDAVRLRLYPLEAGAATGVFNAGLGEALPALLLTSPVILPNVAAPVSVAAFIRLDALQRIAGRSGVFRIFLLDSAGKVLIDRDPAHVLQLKSPDWLPAKLQARLRGQRWGQTATSTLEFRSAGTEMIGAFAKVATAGLMLGVQIPKSTAYLTARELLDDLAGVAVGLLLLAALLSLLWARQITRPVVTLARAAQEVGQGRFDVQVEVRSNDEMGALARSFNRMTSELQAREAALKKAQAALIQSEKMSAFGQLSAGIAHEVKNPLAGILGYAQLALRKIDEDSPAKRHLALIEKETKRCKVIIENLMKFARREKAVKARIDVNAVVEAACDIVAHQLGLNRVRLEQHLAEKLPPIMADGNQIQQVLMNLMINAQQAMDGEPGTVTVSTAPLGDDRIVITVQDDGPGMPEDIQAQIFEPFFTTKQVGQGTGLGLSVSYGIVRDHEGDIKVTSRPGQGATFTLILPRA